MNDIILIVTATLSLATVICCILMLRRSGADFAPLQGRFDGLQSANDRLLDLLRSESARARTEAGDSASQLRTELSGSNQSLQQSLISMLSDLGSKQHTALDRFAVQVKTTTDQAQAQGLSIRDEISRSLKAVGESTAAQVRAGGEAQQQGLAGFATQLVQLNQAFEVSGRSLREEMLKALNGLTTQLTTQAKQDAELQRAGLEGFAKRLETFGTTLEGRFATLVEGTTKSLTSIREETKTAAAETRKELAMSISNFQEGVKSQLAGNVTQVQTQLAGIAEASEKKLEAVRTTVDQRLNQMQTDNATKLELMRQTVDEKLQGTLERRLGESFKQVSDRLEQVHKGLGDMQTLASGVGDLKKVLTNVKTRGTWGEVQLGNLLDQMLTRDQYAINVATHPDSRERVEFAIRMPGRTDDPSKSLWLPIDSKCPVEDYQRLVDAADRADAEGVRESTKQLELRIKACAKDIADKYISPPHTTDFAILFVPTEGLYAEILRIPGLAETLQRDYRVMAAGPTTLAATLNSLQMGFRTLAIEKRSSEVWNVLAAVKVEFAKFGTVFDKVSKKLTEASNTVEEASRRTRAMNRQLRNVEEMSQDDAAKVLQLPAMPTREDEGDAGGDE
ncbi:MAG: DNA recombination protein RmuC [Planctomycetota bacterium]|nr:DNA recombination protein RmuC [Planctomycetota bacterium]